MAILKMVAINELRRFISGYVPSNEEWCLHGIYAHLGLSHYANSR